MKHDKTAQMAWLTTSLSRQWRIHGPCGDLGTISNSLAASMRKEFLQDFFIEW